MTSEFQLNWLSTLSAPFQKGYAAIDIDMNKYMYNIVKYI